MCQSAELPVVYMAGLAHQLLMDNTSTPAQRMCRCVDLWVVHVVDAALMCHPGGLLSADSPKGACTPHPVTLCQRSSGCIPCILQRISSCSLELLQLSLSRLQPPLPCIQGSTLGCKLR